MLAFAMLFSLGCGGDKKHEGHDMQSESSARKEAMTYACPMHPDIIRDAPGLCPICGMQLTMRGGGGNVDLGPGIEAMLSPTNAIAIGSYKTVTPVIKELPSAFSATGTIGYDTRNIHNVSARVDGWVDKLYVKYRYQPIAKGQRLMDIYSKVLLTAEQNYLFLLDKDPDNTALITAAAEQLALLGFSTDQVDELKRTRTADPKVAVYSPYSGYLIEDDPSVSNGSTGGMDASAPQEEAMRLREGMYVAKGSTVFRIVNTNTVWAVLNLHAGDGQDRLRKGQNILLRIDGLDGDSVQGTVAFLEPVYREGLATLSLRVIVPNPDGRIIVGSRVSAVITGDTVSGSFIPAISVVSTGEQQVAFVKHGPRFHGRKVQIGVRSGEWVQVLAGIAPTDTLAANGQLLIDSESFVRTTGNEP
ncbi:MAG: efflux RND transporter periplasmic adaptor subunit [Flavobacteriales bacterium]